MTFSIAARCSETGMLGVAVSTAVPAVGSVCPFGAAGVGAVATQAWVNPYLGLDALELLSGGGACAEDVVRDLIGADPSKDIRQLGIVDRHGHSSAYSGSGCTPYFGHFIGDNYSVQGNMLIGAETLAAMVERFTSTTGVDLPERLLQCLEAGQSAGGDKRGRQSAAVKVYRSEAYPYVDLRVDEHRQPVAELRRVFEVWRHQMLPFMEMMPTRTDPVGGHDQKVVDFVLLSPEERADRL